MNTEETKENVGSLVMSTDAGHKMIACVREPHGPYLLTGVTKGGFAVLEGREDCRVKTSLLTLYKIRTL